MNLARRTFPRSASLLALNEWREKESKNGLQSAVSASGHGAGGCLPVPVAVGGAPVSQDLSALPLLLTLAKPPTAAAAAATAATKSCRFEATALSLLSSPA